MRLFVLMFVFLLGACASNPSAVGPGLKALQGQELRTAIQYLGYPDRTQTVLDDKVYIWAISGTYSDVFPITDFDRGTFEIDGRRGEFRKRRTNYITEVQSYRCVIKIATDKDDVIKHAAAQSQGGGCREYDEFFRELLNDFDIPIEESAETLEKPV